MEQQGNQKAPASLLPGVLDHLGLTHTASAPAPPVESLLAMLHAADWRTRAKAIAALEAFAHSIPLDTLLTTLHDEDASVRAACVRTLGRKGPIALPYITVALDDSAWLVREAAVLTLGELGGQTSAEKLLASLDDENEFVREAASLMLERNRALRSDEEDDEAADTVSITTLETFAYTSTPRQRFTFVKPRRLAAAILTGLVVIGLLASWLVLIPAIRSSRSASQRLSPEPGTLLFKAHFQGGAYLPQWTRDGKRMAFVDDFGHMYVWDAGTKKLKMTFTLPFHPNPDPLAVWSWTSDGEHIVSFDFTTVSQPGPSGLDTATIYLWDALTGQKVVSIPTRTSAWADDGKSIAIAGQDNIIHVLDMNTGQELFTFTSEHFKQFYTICWSPDGQRIATSSRDGTVEIWNAATGKRLQSFSDPGIASQNNYDITYLFTTWSPDSTRILVQRADSEGVYKLLQIWDVTNGRKLLTFSAHTTVPFLTVYWFSDGKRILSSSSNEVLIWEAATGQILLRIPRNTPDGFNFPVLSPDERVLAFTDGGPTIQLWDTNTGQKLFTYRGHTASVVSAVTPLAWSPDGAAISSADTDGNILVWEAATGKLLFKYKLNFSLPSQFIPTNLAFLVWSPDGTRLAVASDDGTIAVLQAN